MQDYLITGIKLCIICRFGQGYGGLAVAPVGQFVAGNNVLVIIYRLQKVKGLVLNEIIARLHHKP